LTVLNLTRGTQKTYWPRAAIAGFGLCPLRAVVSPNGTAIAMLACVWGGPEELFVLDFRDPFSMPHPVLYTEESEWWYEGIEFKNGWLNFSIKKEIDLPKEFDWRHKEDEGGKA
jgi:hypothetical protein